MIEFVEGAGGTRIALRATGNPDGHPLLFVHGWAQSSGAWRFQLANRTLGARFRLLACDLRGHGESDVPDGGYDDPEAWADDLAAVLRYAGAPVTAVGWSYGGLVLTDYLRVHGADRLAGLVLAGAITEIGGVNPGGRIGPAMRAALPGALSDDPATAIPALAAFSENMAKTAIPGDFAQSLFGTALRTPPSVRAALFRRTVGSGDVLTGLDLPVLVTHGTADDVVDITAGEYAAGKIPGARRRWFQDAGHLPFAERAAEFNSAVAEFALDS